MKIIFVRHGEAKNDKLTMFGKKQAKMIVRELCYENISKIYSSPLERAKRTALIIGEKINIKNIITDERIREREKKTDDLSESEKREFDENYLNPKFSRKNPEGCHEYISRISSFLKDVIASNEKDSSILIVAHSSMIYAMAEFFIGKNKSEKINWMRIGNCSKLCFEC